MTLPTTLKEKIASAPVLVTAASLFIGLVGGGAAIYSPRYFVFGLGAIAIVACCFSFFEQTVLLLLIVRSSLDAFSSLGLPAAFAVGLDILVLVYIAGRYLAGQKIHTDKAWWFFASWIAIQGLWPMLTALNGLPLSSGFTAASVREWVRIFSWLMIYLVVNQFKEKLHPEQVIDKLFYALVIPLSVAALQLLLPVGRLPGFLQSVGGSVFAASDRISSTLGHPNTFATFLVLFAALTYWKLGKAKQTLPWLMLLSIEIFFLVTTKALVGLSMLIVLGIVLTLPQLSLRRFAGAFLIFIVLLGLFMGTEFGREKLASVLSTPLLNSDITINRAILLSWFDSNSFNWRLAQWTFLIEEWKRAPIFGYGLGLATYLGPIRAYAHNDYVRVLVEGGVVGFLAFIAFQFWQLLHLLKLWTASVDPSKKRFCLCLIAVLIAALVGMVTENIWTHTAFFLYWWTLFSLLSWEWTPQGPPSVRLPYRFSRASDAPDVSNL